MGIYLVDVVRPVSVISHNTRNLEHNEDATSLKLAQRPGGMQYSKIKSRPNILSSCPITCLIYTCNFKLKFQACKVLCFFFSGDCYRWRNPSNHVIHSTPSCCGVIGGGRR